MLGAFHEVSILTLLCCRADAQKVEEWAKTQSPSSLVEFASRDGEIEGILKDIAERAGTKGSFSYSRFFAVGLFRLLELSNSTEPNILDKVKNPISIHPNVNSEVEFFNSGMLSAQLLIGFRFLNI